MSKIRWGIIGTGKIALRFASDLQYAPNAELSGVAGRNLPNVRKFAEEFQTTAFQTYDELLNSDADVIYVATPHSSHLEHSLRAIRAGKAVLCEKPFAINCSQTEKILEAAKSKNVFVMEAMWTRFFPAIREVLSLVKSGELGSILRIETSFGYESSFDPLSRIFDPALGGGSLLDVGIYPLALTHMLLEESPAEIVASGKLSSTGVDESVSWAMTYSSGTRFLGESSVVNVLANEAVITGSDGEIRIPQFWCPKEYTLNGVTRSFDFPGRGFQFEALEVMRCLREGIMESPLQTHANSLHVMRQMESIRKMIGVRYPQDL